MAAKKNDVKSVEKSVKKETAAPVKAVKEEKPAEVKAESKKAEVKAAEEKERRKETCKGG